MAFEWIRVVLRIPEIPDSNLDPETDIMTDAYVVLLSLSRQMPEQYLKICHGNYPSHHFQFIIRDMVWTLWVRFQAEAGYFSLLQCSDRVPEPLSPEVK
jgi:hypothetical protein